MPELIVVAGANGSGKSTLTKLFPVELPIIDPDAIAREIDPIEPESVALSAGRQALERARLYIQTQRSFLVETTLSGNTYLNLMRKAKGLGWFVSLIYIGIEDPTTNIQRVRSRVKLGGHDVPREDILRRYDRSLANLDKAAKIANRLVLYDNSSDGGHQLIAIIEDDAKFIYVKNFPLWIDRTALNFK